MRFERSFLLVLAMAVVSSAADYELAGIKLGAPLKDAMAALRAHNPKMELKPESAAYPGLPNALTYGIAAVGAGEGFYFLVTMPPSEPMVSKITWVVHFGQDNIPKQDVLVANLAKQFGPISMDTLPVSLDLGSRDLYWVDDAQGNRIRVELVPKKCRNESSFYLTGLTPGRPPKYDPTKIHLPPIAARLRIEQGYTNKEDPVADACGDYTMIRARLFRASFMGVRVPNLVEYLVVMIASGPMDRSATNATHAYWTNAVKSGVAKPGAAGGGAPQERQSKGKL